MFSEVTEVRDAIHLLTPRAVNEEVGKRLLEEMEWYDNYLNMGKTDRSANPSPGNKKGGLANVVEKALGSIAKSGKSAIVEVLSPGQRPTKRGLIYAATPASDFVCGTQQVASGITRAVNVAKENLNDVMAERETFMFLFDLLSFVCADGNEGMVEGKCPNRAESPAMDSKSQSLVLMNFHSVIQICLICTVKSISSCVQLEI